MGTGGWILKEGIRFPPFEFDIAEISFNSDVYIQVFQRDLLRLTKKFFGQSCFRTYGGVSPSFGIFGIGRCLAVLLDSVWSVLHSFRSVRTAQPSSWSTGQRLCTSQRPGSTPLVLGGRLYRVAAWWLHTLLMPALLLVFGVLWHTCMFCAVWSTTRLELGPHTL